MIFPSLAQRLTVASRSAIAALSGHRVGGEARVRKRVFVRAIKARFGGQFGEPLKRAVHLLRRSFEQAAAAHREQGVADEGNSILLEDQRDMPERVTGDFDHPADVIAEAELVAFA